MGFESVLSMARRLVTERLQPGGIAIDATAGSGVDTLFLAQTAGPGGTVYACDVQESALARTEARLKAAAGEIRLAPVELVLAGHERMAEFVPKDMQGRIRAVMFNLGYLPGGDQSVITKPKTTLAALDAALALLAPGGVLTIVAYPGHPGGETEGDAVTKWAAEVPSVAAQSMQYRFIQKINAPYLVALEKT